jgi:glycosyltransferase involved in cell wall biosynthesis
VPVASLVSLHRGRGTWQHRVSRFIALTHFARVKFIAAGFPAEKLVVKPNFYASEIPDEQPHERVGALFVGRLSREKGIGTLLRAWSDLRVPLTVVGDGPLRAQIRGPNVTAAGALQKAEVVRHMRQAQFLVMPSEWYEGFPMVLAEAFACALPVLTSKIGSLAEIVEDGLTGLHFEPGNAGDLSEKAHWMAQHPDECARMGRTARETFMARYTPERNYDLLLEVYSSLLR